MLLAFGCLQQPRGKVEWLRGANGVARGPSPRRIGLRPHHPPSIRVTAWTGNDTRTVGMTPTEVRDGLADGDGLLRAIREEGQVLFGDPRYLHKAGRAGEQVRG